MERRAVLAGPRAPPPSLAQEAQGTESSTAVRDLALDAEAVATPCWVLIDTVECDALKLATTTK